MGRPFVIAANWKMHKLRSEALEYATDLTTWVEDTLGDKAPDLQLVVAPPATVLELVAETGPPYGVFAQNMHFESHGAYTGEISASMIKDCGAHGVLLGHSERRQYFAETDEALAKKMAAALELKLRPMLCVGESIDDRRAGRAEEFVGRQLEVALGGVTIDESNVNLVYIAYEPIWAIGTGEAATPAMVQEMHAFIRSQLAALFGAEIADRLPILYGGSVKPDNAEELLALPDVDGALIGGASLEVPSFTAIVEAGMRVGSVA